MNQHKSKLMTHQDSNKLNNYYVYVFSLTRGKINTYLKKMEVKIKNLRFIIIF